MKKEFCTLCAEEILENQSPDVDLIMVIRVVNTSPGRASTQIGIASRFEMDRNLKIQVLDYARKACNGETQA